MPSITQLEYILAVHRTGHFGRAAEACHAAQPTLSAQIQKAEAELGVTLFDRGRKPVEATPKARPLIQEMQAVVSAHERLMWLSRGTAEEVSGDFSLGIIPTLAPYVVPWFLFEFSKALPKVNLALYERPTDQIIEELRHQRLDAAVLATPLEEPSIVEEPLFYDPFYLYAHPEEEILRQDDVTQEDLLPQKIWLLEDGHCVRTQVTRFCGVKGSSQPLANVAFAAGSFETLRHLIDAAGGYSLFPETYVRTLPRSVAQRQVRAFSPQTPTREVSLVHLQSAWKTDVMDVLKECIRVSLPRSIRLVDKDGEILSLRPIQ
jgi:LysR family transcriptional regulator, hydrogen peroxide-inducible genes activator